MKHYGKKVLSMVLAGAMLCSSAVPKDRMKFVPVPSGTFDTYFENIWFLSSEVIV